MRVLNTACKLYVHALCVSVLSFCKIFFATFLQSTFCTTYFPVIFRTYFLISLLRLASSHKTWIYRARKKVPSSSIQYIIHTKQPQPATMKHYLCVVHCCCTVFQCFGVRLQAQDLPSLSIMSISLCLPFSIYVCVCECWSECWVWMWKLLCSCMYRIKYALSYLI